MPRVKCPQLIGRTRLSGEYLYRCDMPAKSEKQRKFMAAVANNPKFAKKVGVPQSVGEEYMKPKKMMAGGMADKMPMMAKKKKKPMMDKMEGMDSMPKMKKGGKVRGCGMAKKGTKSAKQVKM